MYFSHLQGQRRSQKGSILFNPEDGRSTFFWNVVNIPSGYSAGHPGRQHSLYRKLFYCLMCSRTVILCQKRLQILMSASPVHHCMPLHCLLFFACQSNNFLVWDRVSYTLSFAEHPAPYTCPVFKSWILPVMEFPCFTLFVLLLSVLLKKLQDLKTMASQLYLKNSRHCLYFMSFHLFPLLHSH
jgi:hypothetical protein